jgi:signal peptidase I
MAIQRSLRALVRRLREFRGILLFVCLMFVLRSAWADWVTVPSGSMNPTILEGDRVLVDKHAFGWRVPFTRLHVTDGDDPVRGDIVVFDSPADGRSLIKRIAAVPGDQVALVDERLIVNGEAASYAPLDGGYVATLLEATRAARPRAFAESVAGRRHAILLLPGHGMAASMATLTVPAGMYFMLGDNRDNSADSRFLGFVPRDRIVGRATRVVVSFDPDRYFLPRGNRLLQPLQ